MSEHIHEPVAEKCPGCGYILDPETQSCLRCGYKPCQFCDSEIEAAGTDKAGRD